MDILFIVILTVVLTVAASGIVFAVMQSRKNGNEDIPWDKIRPILTEMFTETVKLMEVREAGYKALEDYAVSYVKGKVESATFLVKEEKALLSESFIRSIIGPRLKELYNEESASMDRMK
jgi:adenine/guanine phosphoribosyltransferase-like PRPP-binding protein